MAFKNKKFYRSQAAHKRLNKLWRDKGNTDKNRAIGNYHADCMNVQQNLGRVLKKPERKKLFAWWWKSDVQGDNKGYPEFK